MRLLVLILLSLAASTEVGSPVLVISNGEYFLMTQTPDGSVALEKIMQVVLMDQIIPPIQLTARASAARDSALLVVSAKRYETTSNLACLLQELATKVRLGTVTGRDDVMQVCRGTTDMLLAGGEAPAWKQFRDLLYLHVIDYPPKKDETYAVLLEDFSHGLKASVPPALKRQPDLAKVSKVIEIVIALLHVNRPLPKN